jgi:hypothetical protein
MKPISYSLKDVLVRQGIANAQPVGAGRVRGMKGPGAASDGARGGVVADAAGGVGPHRPTAGGGNQPMGISREKDGAAKPRQFNREVGKHVSQEPSMARSHPVPRIVVDNSRNWRTQAPRVAPLGVRQFLVLVSSR